MKNMKYYDGKQILIILVFSIIFCGSIYLVGAELGAVGSENRVEFLSDIIESLNI